MRCMYLAHHGIKGMKWGIRRYQNSDGSLTPEGRARYLTRYKGETTDDLSKEGGKAVKKFLKKNPGNYSNALWENEWEHDFGTFEFSKEVLKKYGALIDQGKIFTSEFADMSALYDAAEKSANSYMDVYGSQHLRNLREYGKRLNSGEAQSKAAESYEESVKRFKQDGAHKSDFAKERGLSTSEAVHDYFKKVAKNLNEGDPDQLTYQRMGEATEMFRRGYITEGTFNKLYDAQLSTDAYDLWDYMMDNADPEDMAWYDHWHDADQKK